MILALLAFCVSSLNAATLAECTRTPASEDSLRKIGGFRCVDLRPLKNDTTFDPYSIGYP
jgi:hypothetical protein